MTEKFHERCNIPVCAEDARNRFVNGVYNDILTDFFYNFLMQEHWDVVSMRVLTALGIKNQAGPAYFQWENKIGDDFWTNVRAAEAMYEAVSHMGVSQRLVKIIENILQLSEVDLGIRWHEGHFLPSGSPLLDEKLVNDVLNCLKPKEFEGVLRPFKKGLEDLIHSIKAPARLQDVVTDVYEALEALAKIVTGRGDKDLSANLEPFIKAVQVSDIYKPILKEYIAYANKIRHAEKIDNPNRTSRVRKLNRLCTWPGFYSSCCNQRSPGPNGYINGHINAVNPSQSKRLKWRTVTCD